MPAASPPVPPAHLLLAAASERLAADEDEAGMRLLDRHARGVHATAAGESLAHHARLMLRQDAMLRGELADFARGRRGRVRLLANTVAIAEHLPGPLARWLAAHPDVDVELKERTTMTLKMVGAGLADLGIVTDALDAEGLQLRPFALDRLVLAVPAGHRLAAGRRVRFAELADERFVGLGDGSALQDHLDEHAAREGFSADIRIRLRSLTACCAWWPPASAWPSCQPRQRRVGRACRACAVWRWTMHGPSPALPVLAICRHCPRPRADC
jgi:DNA-binding transcriptional LysR family regulator